MSNETIEIESLIKESEIYDTTFLINSSKATDFKNFMSRCHILLANLKKTHPIKFENIVLKESFSIQNHRTRGDYYSDTKIRQTQICLEACLRLLKTTVNSEISDQSPIEILEMIAKNFHRAARKLKERNRNKDCFDIIDEYDVQDLFESYLSIFFENIKKENSVPEFAGSNSRIDFILPKEKIGIEIKKTRRGLDSNKLGEELLIDIRRYERQPEIDYLFCFVYDNEHILKNPAGIESDLSIDSNPDFKIMVRIFPK